jgi:serine/threonine protein phosphatase PrpC
MLIDNQIDARVSVRRLADMALAKAVKKQDNTTVVLIQYHGRKTEE